MTGRNVYECSGTLKRGCRTRVLLSGTAFSDCTLSSCLLHAHRLYLAGAPKAEASDGDGSSRPRYTSLVLRVLYTSKC